MVQALKPSLVLKFSLLLLVGATGWARGQLWGVETELLAERLRNGNYELLQHLDFEELEVSHAKRLGDGALFYLSEIYAELELPESRRRFLEAALNHEADPWRQEAAERLLAYYRGRGMHRRQGEVAQSLLRSYPEWDALRLYYLEALYEQERYEELAEALSPLVDTDLDGGTAFPKAAEDLLLWSGVTRHELGDAAYVEPFLRLFGRHRASTHHVRVYRYLEFRGLLDSDFDASERFWLEFRMAAAEEDSSLLESLVYDLNGENLTAFLDEPTAVDDFLARALGDGRADEKLSAFLRRGIGTLSNRGGHRSVPILRRGIIELHDRNGNLHSATEEFALLMREVPRWQRNSLLGSRVASLMERHPEDALKLIESYAAPEPDSWYLRRAIEELTTELLRRVDWDGLARLYSIAEANRYPAAAARLAVLLSQGPDGDTAAGRLRLESAQEQSVDSYYRLLASILLGDNGRDAVAPRVAGGTASATDVAEPAREESIAFVAGYLDYGLSTAAFAALQDRWDSIRPDDALLIARHFAREGRYYESMRVAERLRRENADIDPQELQELRYPRAFAPLLEGMSERYGLPVWLWYALIREESYFAPAIESHAGAVGLAQLMPATAAEVADREGINAPDLTNPEINLRLGASYLSRLLDRFEEPAFAVLAYNGGQGRVRRWLAADPMPTVLLFHESIPVYETRHYLRKILLTAASYALLYDQQDPRDTVQSVFRELEIR